MKSITEKELERELRTLLFRVAISSSIVVEKRDKAMEVIKEAIAIIGCAE